MDTPLGLNRVSRLRADLANAAGSVDLEAAVEAVLLVVVAVDHAGDDVDRAAECVAVVVGVVPVIGVAPSYRGGDVEGYWQAKPLGTAKSLVPKWAFVT